MSTNPTQQVPAPAEWMIAAAREVYPDIAAPLDPSAEKVRARLAAIIAQHCPAPDDDEGRRLLEEQGDENATYEPDHNVMEACEALRRHMNKLPYDSPERKRCYEHAMKLINEGAEPSASPAHGQTEGKA